MCNKNLKFKFAERTVQKKYQGNLLPFVFISFEINVSRGNDAVLSGGKVVMVQGNLLLHLQGRVQILREGEKSLG
jgi:hypothetical protein